MDKNILVVNIGVLANGVLPIFRAPSGFGGLTIMDVTSTFLTAGTAGLHLIDAGTAGTGTGAAGTLASNTGATAHAAKVPNAWTLASAPYLGEGKYLAVKEDNTGTSVTVSEVAIAFAWGK